VTVPRVLRLGFVIGLRRLSSAGFRPVVRYVSSTRPTGTIVAQTPATGTAPRGSRVRVAVSEGPSPAPLASVPNVIGSDQATATSTLRQAGFKVLVLFRKATNQSQDGLVIDQQPQPGARSPTGSFVASSSAVSPARADERSRRVPSRRTGRPQSGRAAPT
jgi:eukaryotic-like serine/threonine-protein kinase